MKKLIFLIMITVLSAQNYQGYQGYIGYTGFNKFSTGLPDIPLIPDDEFTVAHWFLNSLNRSPLSDITGNGNNLTAPLSFDWQRQFLDYAPLPVGRALYFDGINFNYLETNNNNFNYSESFTIEIISMDVKDGTLYGEGSIWSDGGTNETIQGLWLNYKYTTNALRLEYSTDSTNPAYEMARSRDVYNYTIVKFDYSDSTLLLRNYSMNGMNERTESIAPGGIVKTYNNIRIGAINYMDAHYLKGSISEVSFSQRAKTDAELDAQWNNIRPYFTGSHLVLNDKDIDVRGHWTLSHDGSETDIVNGKTFGFNGAPVWDGFSPYGEGLKAFWFDGDDDGAYMTAGDTPFFTIPAGQSVTWEAIARPRPVRTNYQYHMITGDVDASSNYGGFALYLDNSNTLRFWFRDNGGNAYIAGNFNATKYINTYMYIVGKYTAGSSLDMYVGTYDSLYHFQENVTTDLGSGGDRPMLGVAGYGNLNFEGEIAEMRLDWEALPEETIVNNWKLRKRDFNGKILDLEYVVYDSTKGLWRDLSKYRNNFAQTYPDSTPLLSSDGIIFDGINDWMGLVKSTNMFDFTNGSGRDYPFTFMSYVNPFIAANAPFLAKSTDTETAYIHGIRDDSVFVGYKVSGNIANNIVSESVDHYSDLGVYTYLSNGSMFVDGDSIALNVTDNGYTGMSDVGVIEIGRYFQSMYLDGSMKVVKIWNRELSADEIKEETDKMIGIQPLLPEDANTVAHYWLNDNNANPLEDISGNGRNLTASANFDWQNQFTDDAPGGGKSLYFDGTDDGFNTSEINFNSNTFSISFIGHFKGNDVGRVVSAQDNVISNNMYSIRFDADSALRYITRDDAVNCGINTSNQFSDIVYVVYTQEPTGGKIYVNGNLELDNVCNLSNVNTTGIPTTIGYNGMNNTEFFNGDLSEITMTNKTLSEAEIQATWDKIKDKF